MKKFLLLFLLISGETWAELPKSKSSCQIQVQQLKFARLVALSSLCDKDENSTYGKKLKCFVFKKSKEM